MASRVLFALLIFFCYSIANAETWTFPGEVEHATLQTTESLTVCTGTGDITLATGCTGGGTQYTITFDATDGSLDVPAGLVVPDDLTVDGNLTLGDTLILTDTTSTNPVHIQTDNDTRYLSILGGANATGVPAASDGAYLVLYGDDRGSTDGGSGAIINVGDNTAAALVVQHNATTVASFDSGGLDVTGLYLTTNDTWLQMKDEAGNAHNILKVNTSGNTVLNAPDTRSVVITAGGDVGVAPGGGAEDWYFVGSTGSLQCQNAGCKLRLLSPDGSFSECSVDNSDNFTCTGL